MGRHSTWNVLGVLVVAGLLGTLLVDVPRAPLAGAASSGLVAATVPASVVVNGAVATETPYFWGAYVDGTSATHTEAALLNQTPIKSLRFGANQIDEENWSANSGAGCLYSTDGSCTAMQDTPSAFAQLCEWEPSDVCILGLPAEINSPSTDAYLMNYLQSTTGWWPTCWAVGNEPENWASFDIPWTSTHWDNGAYDNVPTAAQFALDAENITGTIRHLDPGACVVGIESTGNPSKMPTWLPPLISDVPNLTQLAYHIDPSINACGSTGLTTWLDQASLTQISSAYTVDAEPNNPQSLPVGVDEFHSICLEGTYGEPAFIAAGIAQALDDGISRVSFFRLYCGASDCLYNTSDGQPSDSFYLYADLFEHMDIGTIYNVTFTGANAGTYMVGGASNSSDRSLLISNAALTWENVSLAQVIPTGWGVQLYSLDNNTGPSEATSVGPGTIELPPQSVAVVHYEAPAVSAQTGTPPPDQYVTVATPGVIFSGSTATTTTLPAILLIVVVVVVLAVILYPRKGKIQGVRK
jgi:hypothetical protein